jgi:DNA-binding protein H-NS
MTGEGSRQGSAALRETLREYEALVACQEREEETEAAFEALEAHRSDFEKLLENETAYLDRTKALFEEERFSGMRFSAAEVRRALSKVRYDPNAGQSSEETSDKLLAAILHLADEKRRRQLAMQLLALLPPAPVPGPSRSGAGTRLGR